MKLLCVEKIFFPLPWAYLLKWHPKRIHGMKHWKYDCYKNSFTGPFASCIGGCNIGVTAYAIMPLNSGFLFSRFLCFRNGFQCASTEIAFQKASSCSSLVPQGLSFLHWGYVHSVMWQGLEREDWGMGGETFLALVLLPSPFADCHCVLANRDSCVWTEALETLMFDRLLNTAGFVTISCLSRYLFKFTSFLLLKRIKQINLLGPVNKANQMLFLLTRLCI